MSVKGLLSKDLIMERLTEVFDPEIHMSIVELGLVYEATARPEMATDAYREAIGRAPLDPLPWFNLARVTYLQGRPEDSLRAYRNVIRLSPPDGEQYAVAVHNAALIERMLQGGTPPSPPQ